MSPHVSVRPAARLLNPWRAVKATAWFVLLLAAAGCAEKPPGPGASAADPNTRVAPVGYRPVLGTYSGARPVEPAPWTGAAKKEGAQ
jgi:hypothetical protein